MMKHTLIVRLQVIVASTNKNLKVVLTIQKERYNQKIPSTADLIILFAMLSYIILIITN